MKGPRGQRRPRTCWDGALVAVTCGLRGSVRDTTGDVRLARAQGTGSLQKLWADHVGW